MKKICLGLLFAAFCTHGVFADCSTPHTLTYAGNQKPHHNEFLYRTKQAYDESVQGYENTKHQNSGDGKGYECDGYNSSGCSDNDILELPAGHVYEGKVINQKRKYQCIGVWNANNPRAFDDWWKVVDDGMCTTRQFGDIPINGKYNGYLTKAQCSGYEKTDETHGTSFELRCLYDKTLKCWAVKCDDKDMTPNANGICEKKGQSTTDVCTATIKGTKITLARGQEYGTDLSADECKSAIPAAFGGVSYDANGVYHFFCGPTCKKVGCKSGYESDESGNCVKKGGGTKTCRESRAKMSLEAIACCDEPNAKWDKIVRGQCVCTDATGKAADPTKEFQIIGGRGKCVQKSSRQCPSGSEPDGTTCRCLSKSEVFDPIAWKCVPWGGNVQCPPDATQSGNTCVCNDPNMAYDGSKCDCTVVENTKKSGNRCVCIEQNKVIKNGKCELSDDYLVRIKATFERLSQSMGGFKKDVWKDAEGNFNTARLASDSIAGIVLGTAGGIITSKVVKKNQLKQGFEDIKCSIGGQNIASYGDEFTVGRQ